MWIQIRTIDGKETRTIEDLSRLTRIESLRLKIQDIFNVNPEQQRLFYRGKQMEDGQTLFDYNVGLNDIVQLLIRSHADAPDSPAPMDCDVIACSSAPPAPPAAIAANPSAPVTATTITSSTVVVINNKNSDNKNNSANKSDPTPPTATTATTATTAPTTTSKTSTNSTSDTRTNNGSKSSSMTLDNQPSTSTRSALVDPGIGLYKMNELVDCRDVSIGSWFEASIENVTRAPKVPKVGRPSKRTNGKLEANQDSNGNSVLNSDSGASTSQTDCTTAAVPASVLVSTPARAPTATPSSTPAPASTPTATPSSTPAPASTPTATPSSTPTPVSPPVPAPASSPASASAPGTDTMATGSTPPTTPAKDREEDVIYHIKYEDYPENGVVEMRPPNVRPRARTLLKWDQLAVGLVIMVNYNMETPEERGFWFDAEITALNEISRTNKELRVKILLGGPGDVIADCKVLFLDEVYQVEKSGAPPLSAADGQFKRKSGPECKHCKADPESECRFCSCCVCGGKQDANMQLLCDECNMAFHIYCLNPPLATIPDEEDWYCPTCKNDTSEVVKAGEKLKASKKKAKMPSAHTESQRDWGKGMACVGRTKECTIVPSNHYGPVPGVPVGTTWKFRVQVSEAGVHRPHVGGIHGRSNDGSYSLVLAGGFEDEVDRGDEFTYTGSGGRDLSGNKRIGEHSFDQTLTHMNRALALNCDAPLNDKDGAESRNWRAGKPVRVIRSSKGRRISKYAPEEGNRYDGIYKVVKYWPEIGKCGFLVWRYLLRRDDLEPAPWTPEGLERIKKLGLAVQYPPGYLEAMANKTKKEASVRGGSSTRGKRHAGRGRPRIHPRKKVKEEEEEEEEEEKPAAKKEEGPQSNGSQKEPKAPDVCVALVEPPAKRVRVEEAFQLSERQQELIKEDTPNKKVWDEALNFLGEGPNFLRKVEQTFMCVCCQELAFQPITTVCTHNVCKSCLQRSFRAEVYSCPACRHDLGKDYVMVLNKTLQRLLDQFFPGYSKGR
ncbi:E3 ubiquitin-protein ligase UHRF1-like isoform X2 [Hypomesus transpacificus]|uniref:E3 ubiquitin-protein ligase UHRF1-like isoform X2 n=1 Tax=Hypomesus transpacificus TaxID=137520 RepID=UPI001F084DA3|nr:E3 ubiquitin-protein ligase UHRF1-like isoform X2 [Hypomesus transpacificus]